MRGRCDCGGKRVRQCETCGRVVCPTCRVAPMVANIQYVECNLCRDERNEWWQELRHDKQFMRWHGFRRYSPTDGRATEFGAARKAARDKERALINA